MPTGVKLLRDRNSNRKFERNTRWNAIMYTIVSRKNENAAYADNYNTDDKKLFLTYIRCFSKNIPIGRFIRLDNPIVLDDFSKLVAYDETTQYYLELDEKNEKARIYWEVKE